MVSYWETGARVPNDCQLSALARLYGIEPVDLLEGRDVEPEHLTAWSACCCAPTMRSILSLLWVSASSSNFWTDSLSWLEF